DLQYFIKNTLNKYQVNEEDSLSSNCNSIDTDIQSNLSITFTNTKDSRKNSLSLSISQNKRDSSTDKPSYISHNLSVSHKCSKSENNIISLQKLNVLTNSNNTLIH